MRPRRQVASLASTALCLFATVSFIGGCTALVEGVTDDPVPESSLGSGGEGGRYDGMGGASVQTGGGDVGGAPSTIASSSSGGNPCANGVLDGDESDTDCGGSCGPCADGLGCADHVDCASEICDGGSCVECKTVLDCSMGDYCRDNGTCGPQKPNGASCDSFVECQSKVCVGGKCSGLGNDDD